MTSPVAGLFNEYQATEKSFPAKIWHTSAKPFFHSNQDITWNFMSTILWYYSCTTLPELSNPTFSLYQLRLLFLSQTSTLTTLQTFQYVEQMSFVKFLRTRSFLHTPTSLRILYSLNKFSDKKSIVLLHAFWSLFQTLRSNHIFLLIFGKKDHSSYETTKFLQAINFSFL